MAQQNRKLSVWHSRVVLFLIIAGCVGIAAIIAAQRLLPRSGWTSVPMPSMSEKVTTHSLLKMEFPTAMNVKSVTDNMIVPSDIEGTSSWEGNTLVYKPNAKLVVGEHYVFHVAKSVLKADNSELGSDLDFTFIASGEPEVTARIPGSGAVNVDAGNSVSVVFDRPIVPLMQVQGSKDTEGFSLPVTIDPPVIGKWRWLSTYVASFVPEKGLTLGTKYTIHVPAGIRTLSGDPTEKDFSWSFETKRPGVVAASPEQGTTLAGPTSQLSLTFNQDVDLSRLLPSLALIQGGKASDDTGQKAEQPYQGDTGLRNVETLLSGSTLPVEGETIAIKNLHYGTKDVAGKKVEDRRTVIIEPAQLLSLKTVYGLKVAKGTLGKEGLLGSAKDFWLRFSTVGALSVKGGEYQDGSIRIPFSNPMNAESLKKAITISPEPEGWKDVTIQVNDWSDGRTATFYPSLKASTTYTVTVSTDAEDSFGQHPAKSSSFAFETPALPPRVSVEALGDFGIFERGKEPIYYVHSVNTSRVDVQFAPLSFGDFLTLERTRHFTPDAEVSLDGRENMEHWVLKTKNVLNASETLTADLEKLKSGSLKSGLYAMTFSAPEFLGQWGESKNKPVMIPQYFTITNTALTVKFSGQHLLVWAVDMRTGDPVAGAKLTVYALDGSSPLTGVTDANGFFDSALDLKKFKLQDYDWQPEFFVTAEKGDDFAFVGSQWNEGMNPNDFNLYSDFHGTTSPDQRLRAYVYTDRPLYAAGDTVHFKGIVRFQDWNGMMHVPESGKNVSVIVNDDQGREVYKTQLTLNSYGSLSGDFPIDKSASLGTYSLSLHFSPDSPVGESNEYASFSVLAYRKPEYRIDLTPKTTDVFNHDVATVDVAGAYYFGAPMAGAQVTWNAQGTDYYFNRYTDGWYSFAAEDAWCYRDCNPKTAQISEGKGTLDAAGHMQISFPTDIDGNALSQVVSVEANVTDLNNQQVSNRTDLFVHKSSVYVGIRSSDYVVTPGDKASVDLVAVSPDGTPVNNQAITVELYSRTWDSVRKKGVDGEYYYDNTPKDTFIKQTTAVTGKDGKATASLVIDGGGEYRFVATAKDAQGRQAKAGTSVYSWSSTYVNWPHANNDRIAIETDKPQYGVGDKATLLVKSPYQGKSVHALLTVERENVMTKQIIDVTSNAQAITIPITEDMIPDAYVSVVIIKPRDGETFDDNGLDTGAPAFKIGYAKLNVERKLKELTVGLSTDKDRYLPGETVKVTLRTSDANGKPAPAELSLSAVDMSLLALAGFRKPDLASTFWMDQGLGVNTSVSLLHLIERYKPGSKGGGGGDLESRKRGNFKDTAYWNPSIATDANGTATVSFVLPDNLTTWKLLAVGGTKSNVFGAGTKDILTTKTVLLRSVRPRFAVRGDKIIVGAIVMNGLDKDATFSTKLTGSGFTMDGNANGPVTIAKGDQKKILFPITVGSVDTLTFDFLTQTPGFRDEVQEQIPVYPFGTPQSVSTTAMTLKDVKEQVVVPTAADAPDGTVHIAVSPTLATYLPTGLDYLAKFPYGCTEQTVSSFLPSVAMKKLQTLHPFNLASNGKLDAIVTDALQRIYGNQRSDGGFGFWKESLRSDAYLTAYVVFALRQTQDAGYSVDQTVLHTAVQYLSASLRSLNAKSSLDAAQRAYVLEVLSENGAADDGLLSNLFDQRDILPTFAKANLAMALARSNSRDLKNDANALLTEIVNTLKIDPRGAHVEEQNPDLYAALMQTNTRSTANVLSAMLLIDPSNTLIPNIVHYLLSVRQDGHWDTTQSTTLSLLAFADFLKQTGELNATYDAQVSVNGAQALSASFTPDTVLNAATITEPLSKLKRGLTNDIGIAKSGSGRLYYDIFLSYFYTPEAVQPLEEGMSIRRTIERVSQPAVETADASVGQTYRVTLTMTSPEDRNFVGVESPLPAGFEPIDLSLQTSEQQLQNVAPSSKTRNSWFDPWSDSPKFFTHTELRDDRVFLFAEHLPAGVYTYQFLVRATTPGTFHDRPSRIWEMYDPETFGQTGGAWFTVKE